MATEKGKSKAPAKGAKASPQKADKPAAAKAAEPTAAPKEAKPAVKAAPAAAPPAVPSDDGAAKAHGFRRKLVGRVVSDKMDKTVTVEVIRNALDTVYRKYVRQRARYKAHDEKNEFRAGDRVEIQEHRPLSREKRWLVTRLVSRAVQE